MSVNLVPFEYRAKNGTLEPCNCTVYVKPDETHIIGVRTKILFDPRKTGTPKRVTGLFIVYDNVEYCSITVSQLQLENSFILYKNISLFTPNFNHLFGRRVRCDVVLIPNDPGSTSDNFFKQP